MTDRDLQVAVERRTGCDIGCAFTYPDYGPEVRALAGDPSKWGAWRQTGPHPRRLVLHTVGVAREVRGSGLAMWPIRRAIEHCVEAYSEGVIALVIEDFHVLRKIGPPTREHALFARPLD